MRRGLSAAGLVGIVALAALLISPAGARPPAEPGGRVAAKSDERVAGEPGARPAAEAGGRPNVVVIMTDDQDFRSMWAMPKTRRLIAARGTFFRQAIDNYSLCCPSRATFLTGQYAHNHGVVWNNYPLGGYRKLKGHNTLPVWLSRAGYWTIHIGKYLNEYGEEKPREVPPGWDDWHGGVDPTTYDYYGFTINNNGRLRTYGRKPKDYSTDVYTGLAVDAIERASKMHRPFFLNLAPNAPHTVAVQSKARMEGTPALPPPRYADVFADAPIPRYPDFNEADISDKTTQLQAIFANPLTDEQISALQDHWRGRMGALLGVDDMVQRVVRTLKRTGEYGNTVIVFVSDNGWILGEHRLYDPVTQDGKPSGVKYLPFEGSTRVPLIIAGPGFPRNEKVNGVVSNADLAPTIADLANVRPGLTEDGISLLKAVHDRRRYLRNRGVLIQTFPNPRAPAYESIRTARYRYDVQVDGQEGLYDLKRDPWELQSVHDDPRYAEIKAILKRRLARLSDCKGETCRKPFGPLPAPGG
ncbi:MAG: sulfatase [Solirubrobacterales bacterium]